MSSDESENDDHIQQEREEEGQGDSSSSPSRIIVRSKFRHYGKAAKLIVSSDSDRDSDMDQSMNSNRDNNDDEFDEDSSDIELEQIDHNKNNDVYPFDVLSMTAILQYVNNCIAEVNNVLQVSPTAIRTLLNHFGWDKEKLFEAYYDSDQEKLFKDAKVVVISQVPVTTSPNGQEEECEICYLTNPSDAMYGLGCGHRFCKACWSEYLTTKIKDEGMGESITCQANDCSILVDDTTVAELVDPEVMLKYQRFIANSFVQCNRLMRWCPSTDCTNAIRVQWIDWKKPITCSCSFRFCFQCVKECHDPLNCEWLKKWLKKSLDDSETSNWIIANTKDCPACSAPIEKNGGCNHMICRNQKCRNEFCWTCLGPWDQHNSNNWNCHQYRETNNAKVDTSRASLERYLFYYNRYANHMQSLKFEKDLHTSVNEKMQEMQKYLSWMDVQFLKKAVHILCLSRQTLMYTYAFAYYLEKNNESAILEDNQKDLESATERLSEYLERDITCENLAAINNIKQKVQDQSNYCESRRKVLLKHVHDGYENDSWTYQNI